MRALPVELLVYIATLCNTNSIMTMSLTCKTLYCKLQPVLLQTANRVFRSRALRRAYDPKVSLLHAEIRSCTISIRYGPYWIANHTSTPTKKVVYIFIYACSDYGKIIVIRKHGNCKLLHQFHNQEYIKEQFITVFPDRVQKILDGCYFKKRTEYSMSLSQILGLDP